MFKKDDKRDFCLVQNLTMGEADFNQSLRLRNQQFIEAAENFVKEESLSAVLKPKMSKDMVEQLKLTHKVVDVVDRPCRRICVTLLRYIVDKPDSFYAQSDCLPGRRGTRILNKFSIGFINLKNLSIYLMLRVLFMIKSLQTNPFVVSNKK